MEDHLNSRDWAAILNPESIGQMLGIAIRVLRRMPLVELPVGPLSTGGAGSYAKNLTRFRYVVTRLRKEGRMIFDSSVFDESLRELARRKGGTMDEQSRYVMQNFYVPLLKSKRISSLICLPDVDGSVGAHIARDVARSLTPPLPIAQLNEDFFPKRQER
jgi:hypothetical protein